VQRVHMKMILQCALAEAVVKVPCVKRKDTDPEPVFQIVRIHAAHEKSVVTDDLGGDEFVDLIQKLRRSVKFSKKAVSCCDIRDGAAELVFHGNDRHKIVVF